MTCVCQKFTIWFPIRDRRTKVSIETIYALSLFIQYPNYTHRVPKVSPGPIIGGLIFGSIFELVYRMAYIWGDYIWALLVLSFARN